MKIGILLGSPGINGGTYVIYEHASRLKQKGHRVILVTKQEVGSEEYAWHSSAHKLEWLTVEQAKAEVFDMLLATWWQSPFLLHELQATHYVYFVQSIETRFFLPPDPQNYTSLDNTIWQDLCEKTYSYALPIITEAAWIQDYIYRKYNNYPQLVRNGIRKDIYTAEGKAASSREPGRFRVLVEGPVDVAYKNVPSSIRLAKEAGADEIWLLTSSAVDQYEHVDRVFSQIPIHETPEIYRSCDLLLKLSYVEGMFGPPLEIFHCGGTALVYDVTGHDEYIVHDQNSYVVKRDDEEEVVRLLRYLRENPEELTRLKQGATQTAAKWPDWENCAAAFEQALLHITNSRPTSRAYLQRYTEELFSTPKTIIKASTLDAFAQREQASREQATTNKDNFVQFYWNSAGNFNDDQTLTKYYPTEQWATIRFELNIDTSPIWFRLDPGVRMGIIVLGSIQVFNITQEKEIISFLEPEEFSVLFLAGDAKWLFPTKKNIIFSYGRDPRLHLPRIEEEMANAGDCLEVRVRLKETGIQQFFDAHQICFPKQLQNTEQYRPWWRRILR